MFDPYVTVIQLLKESVESDKILQKHIWDYNIMDYIKEKNDIYCNENQHQTPSDMEVIH